MQILEKLITLMIDICSSNYSTLYLKEDIGYFRNLCQHQSMNLLTKVLLYLRNKCEKVYLAVEKEVGEQKLLSYLSEEYKETSSI